MLRGDLAQSIQLQTSVTEVILERFGFTIQLRLGSLACALQQGITTGVLSVLRPNGWTDDPVQPHGLLRHVDTPCGAEPGIDIRLCLQFRWFPPSGSEGLNRLTLGFVSAGGGPAEFVEWARKGDS